MGLIEVRLWFPSCWQMLCWAWPGRFILTVRDVSCRLKQGSWVSFKLTRTLSAHYTNKMIVFLRTANKARIVVEKMTWFLSLTWALNLSPVSTSCYWPCCSVSQAFSGWIPSCAHILTCTRSHTDLQTFPARRQRMRLRTEVVSCLKMKAINILRLSENNLRFNKVCHSNLLFLYFFIFHSYGKCSVCAVVILLYNLPEIINHVYCQCFCVREFLRAWNACVIFVPGWPKPRLYLAVAVKILWISESGTEHKVKSGVVGYLLCPHHGHIFFSISDPHLSFPAPFTWPVTHSVT